MNVGIVGLGLIGGSFAKAFKANYNSKIYAYDVKNDILEFARYMQIVDSDLDSKTIGECDYIFISIYPQECIKWLENNASYIKNNAFVIDCCGVKEQICSRCFEIAKEHNFNFIGGHPMAGYHKSGLKYSRDTMFKGASMILVPPHPFEIDELYMLTELFKGIGFSSITVTDGETHDINIAFSSQLAHIVSNAYVKSPRAMVHKGFSSGSYKDLTRVAYLNEDMWSELFMLNKKNIINELDFIINELGKYKNAIENDNVDELKNLLKEGKERKELIDK